MTELAKKEADYIPKAFIKGKRHMVKVHYKPYPDGVSREIKKSVK